MSSLVADTRISKLETTGERQLGFLAPVKGGDRRYDWRDNALFLPSHLSLACKTGRRCPVDSIRPVINAKIIIKAIAH